MLRDQTIYVIYWDNYGQGAYLYGSGVIFKGDGSVMFENDRMPSGFSIKKWSSQTSFLTERCEPSLPLLKEGEKYMVRPCMKISPPGTVLLRAEFFNRQHQRISFQFLEGADPVFEVPEGTYSYNLELIQSGSKKVIFYGILLCADIPPLRRVVMDWTTDTFLQRAEAMGRKRMFWVKRNGSGRRS